MWRLELFAKNMKICKYNICVELLTQLKKMGIELGWIIIKQVHRSK